MEFQIRIKVGGRSVNVSTMLLQQHPSIEVVQLPLDEWGAMTLRWYPAVRKRAKAKKFLMEKTGWSKECAKRIYHI